MVPVVLDFSWSRKMSFPSCIRGYHVYHTQWEARIGEILDCRREPSNPEDRYAICVLKNDMIVGHLPKKLSRLFSLFIRRGGSVTCEVTGLRRYSDDLLQGGLEIPCLLRFEGSENQVDKLKGLLASHGKRHRKRAQKVVV